MLAFWQGLFLCGEEFKGFEKEKGLENWRDETEFFSFVIGVSSPSLLARSQELKFLFSFRKRQKRTFLCPFREGKKRAEARKVEQRGRERGERMSMSSSVVVVERKMKKTSKSPSTLLSLTFRASALFFPSRNGQRKVRFCRFRKEKRNLSSCERARRDGEEYD